MIHQKYGVVPIPDFDTSESGSTWGYPNFMIKLVSKSDPLARNDKLGGKGR